MKKLPTRRINNLLYAAIAVVSACAFGASAFALQDGTQTAAPAAPQVAGQASTPIADFHYNPKGKIDPFRPLVREAKRESKPRPGGLTALERLGLDQMKLVGIGGHEKARLAVITDTKGKSYILFPGSHVGPHKGRVMEILQDKIVIEEPVSGEGGKKRFRRVPLLLHKEESEEK